MFPDNAWTSGASSAAAPTAPTATVTPMATVTAWSRLEDKQFERALVMFPEETPDRWRHVAAQVPGKTPWEVQEHYEDLVHDVSEIDSGRVEPPCYSDDSFSPSWDSTECRTSQISFGSRQKHTETTERKKGVPWSEEEHKLFLIGLQRFGKGDWRSISRRAVITRTPTQVASHAQKYFNRLNSGKKEKKRASIHDITMENSSIGQLSDQSFNDPLVVQSQQQQPSLPAQGLVPHDQRGFNPGYQGFGLPPM